MVFASLSGSTLLTLPGVQAMCTIERRLLPEPNCRKRSSIPFLMEELFRKQCEQLTAADIASAFAVARPRLVVKACSRVGAFHSHRVEPLTLVARLSALPPDKSEAVSSLTWRLHFRSRRDNRLRVSKTCKALSPLGLVPRSLNASLNDVHEPRVSLARHSFLQEVPQL